MPKIDASQLRPTILTIIGITGDLSRKKLLPAIERLAAAGELPGKFKLVGISRRSVSEAEVLKGLPGGADAHAFICDHLEMVQMDLKQAEEYDKLKDRLRAIESDLGGQAQKLFYLSIPPQISEPIIEHLGEAGFGQEPDTKLLLEKPFGSDYDSADTLVKNIQRYFDEQHVYRIDHYLAKEMAQNILVFRGGNSLFRRTWSKDFIERIEIVAAERIGIEGRVMFYEQTGALGDLVQSHLLQLAALVLMDLPKDQSWDDVPNLRLAAIRQLHIPDTMIHEIKRAQYEGYADEVGHPQTSTETFVSLTLESKDSRWQGVPITLTTGKALDEKYTEIRILYRQENAREANELILRIQPREGIELALWSKRPGYSRELDQVQLAYQYHERAPDIPKAYEQVFLSAIQGDHTLFTSNDEVLASWEALQPVHKLWRVSKNGPARYERGRWPHFKTDQ